jgi:hypothetical protein
MGVFFPEWAVATLDFDDLQSSKSTARQVIADAADFACCGRNCRRAIRKCTTKSKQKRWLAEYDVMKRKRASQRKTGICIAARHTAAAASCGVEGRQKAVLDLCERGSCLKAPLPVRPVVREPRAVRQTARAFSLCNGRLTTTSWRMRLPTVLDVVTPGRMNSGKVRGASNRHRVGPRTNPESTPSQA